MVEEYEEHMFGQVVGNVAPSPPKAGWALECP